MPIELKSSDYKRQADGSVTLSVVLDKDQVECCVCLSAMSSKIYRCRGTSNPRSSGETKIVCHNICAQCEWQMRRMKQDNGKRKKMQCPICKIRGEFVRNRPLERQLHELSKPCRHAASGCSQRFFPWDDTRSVHEDHLCLYQSVDCPFCYQSIPGGRGNFIEHVLRSTNSDSHEEAAQFPMDWASENDEVGGLELASAEYVDEESSPQAVPEEAQRAASSNPIDEEKECHRDEEHHRVHSTPNRGSGAHRVPGCAVAFHRSAECPDMNQLGEWVLRRDRNEFAVSHDLGVTLCAIAPTQAVPCWKVYVLSINPRHGMRGNSRIYLQHFDYDLMREYKEKEAECGLNVPFLSRPTTSTVMMPLSRLHPTSLRKLFRSYPATNPLLERVRWAKTRKSVANPLRPDFEMKDDGDGDHDDEMEDADRHRNHNGNDSEKANAAQPSSSRMDQDDDLETDCPSDLEEFEPEQFSGQSPCSDIQCASIFAGMAGFGQREVANLCVRLFTLEESFKVGAIIDARDFTGEWFEAEILAVQDSNGVIFQDIESASDECLEIRRSKIHYLGYSASYDEWLDVDTDSQRIAQRGTFTIGPNLRAIRKNSNVLSQQRQQRQMFIRHREVPELENQ